MNFRMLFTPHVPKFDCLFSSLVINSHTHSATQPIFKDYERQREELQEILLQGKQHRVYI